VTRCPGRGRHWRIAWRTVGLRTPVCLYCGSANPRPLTEAEWADLIDWAEHYSVGDHVRVAIEARQAQRGAEAARPGPATMGPHNEAPAHPAAGQGRTAVNQEAARDR
jgi:hypothetical protein